MANNALAMQDQEMMRDALSSEKQMTGLYNAFANDAPPQPSGTRC